MNQTALQPLQQPNPGPAGRDLIDIEQLRQQIADGGDLLEILRGALEQASNTLDQRYRANQKIGDIVRGRARMVDQLLNIAWSQLPWPDKEQVSLIAVGGYGRGELLPHSDIDLLILTRKSNSKNLKDPITRFCTTLWDIGLEIGHSVRSIKQCAEEARKDITVATTLMEARTIAGPAELCEQMLEITCSNRVWPIKKFVRAKLDEQRARHEKYQDIDYALEPNVKTSPGGLRDIQTIAWVSKRHFGAQTFRELVKLGFLKKSEETLILRGQDFLWKLRYGLHLLSGRREDRLLFDRQRQLAEMFGYQDDEKQLGVEKLMKQYYRAVGNLREVNDVLLQHFDEAILRADEKERIEPINRRFQIRNGYIEVTSQHVFQRYPSALLEVFVLIAQNPAIEGVRASTIRLIRENRHLINAEYREDIRNVTLFTELLRSPNQLTLQLRRMARYGILGRYLPEFGQIKGQMQHDMFHIYCVDAHTLQVVENMRRLLLPQALNDFPIVAEIARNLPKIELLYVAGLYHDIAKGRGGDHSELGKVDAANFCLRHRLSEWDTQLVTWLVDKHLYMSMTAQRKDISDPAVVRDFSEQVGDKLHLDYLYCLTVADICATNPTLWNTWRASLLRQLYENSKRMLHHGLENPVNRDARIADKQAGAMSILMDKGAVEAQVLQLWKDFSDEYFLRETAANIAWHSETILNAEPPVETLVSLREVGSAGQHEGATQVFIYSRDAEFLFANCTAALEKLNLNVLGARLFTTHSDYCMDTYTILEDGGWPVGKNPRRRDEIRSLVLDYVSRGMKDVATVQWRRSRKEKYFVQNSRVSVSLLNPDSSPLSILEINCPDQPGLLASIGKLFIDYDINLKDARITTLGEKVEDLFYITNKDGQPIRDRDLVQQLIDDAKSRLEERLGV